MNNSKKSLQKAFSAAVFDPRKPGPLATIVEVNDQLYLMKRAAEVLRDAERFEGVERWAKLRDAVAIAGYAMTLTLYDDIVANGLNVSLPPAED